MTSTTLPAPTPGYGWVWTGYRWEQHPVVAPPPQPSFGWTGYYSQQPVSTYFQAGHAGRPRRAVTRRAFNHSWHIGMSAKTLGIWLVTGYPLAYAWNRWGPEKAVTTWR